MTNTLEQEARTRVAFGAKLLDEFFGDSSDNPEAWWKMVDLEYLDITTCSSCVLGLIFGDYERGLDTLEVNSADADLVGFNTYDIWALNASTIDLGYSRSADELKKAWTLEIQLRRARG